MLSEVINTDFGRILVSIILGFGLATMFVKVCNGSGCTVIQGPPMKEIKETVYRIDDTCYKYTPVVTDCQK
jgi:hypothetical protein